MAPDRVIIAPVTRGVERSQRTKAVKAGALKSTELCSSAFVNVSNVCNESLQARMITLSRSCSRDAAILRSLHLDPGSLTTEKGWREGAKPAFLLDTVGTKMHDMSKCGGGRRSCSEVVTFFGLHIWARAAGRLSRACSRCLH